MSDEFKIPKWHMWPGYTDLFRKIFPDSGEYEELPSAARDEELRERQALGIVEFEPSEEPMTAHDAECPPPSNACCAGGRNGRSHGDDCPLVKAVMQAQVSPSPSAMLCEALGHIRTARDLMVGAGLEPMGGLMYDLSELIQRIEARRDIRARRESKS